MFLSPIVDYVINNLVWFDNDSAIKSKYHQLNNCVLSYCITHILSLQDVFVCRSMFYLIFFEIVCWQRILVQQYL